MAFSGERRSVPWDSIRRMHSLVGSNVKASPHTQCKSRPQLWLTALLLWLTASDNLHTCIYERDQSTVEPTESNCDTHVYHPVCSVDRHRKPDQLRSVFVNSKSSCHLEPCMISQCWWEALSNGHLDVTLSSKVCLTRANDCPVV